MKKRTLSSELLFVVRALAVGYLVLLGVAGIRVFFARLPFLSAEEIESTLSMPYALCVFFWCLPCLPPCVRKQRSAFLRA